MIAEPELCCEEEEDEEELLCFASSNFGHLFLRCVLSPHPQHTPFGYPLGLKEVFFPPKDLASLEVVVEEGVVGGFLRPLCLKRHLSPLVHLPFAQKEH